MPRGNKHRHKKEKYYGSYDVNASSRHQIMAGDDSPTEKRDEFHFGRSTPPPTTSYVANKQDFNIDVKTVAEPPKEEKDKDKEKDKEKDKDDKDDVDILGPGANPGYNPDEIRRRDEEVPKKRDKRDDNDRDRDKDNPGKKIDGSDCLDGQWIPPKDSKQQPEEEEDDNCTVKCLYYTMQCCECSIS